MTTLKGYIPTMLMLVTLIFGATAANAGIIVNGRDAQASTTTTTKSQTETCGEQTSSVTGIIVNGFYSVLSFAKTGIIVNGFKASRRTMACGIIVNG